MSTMPENSVDIIITDPPYGTEGGRAYGRGELWSQGNGLHRTIVGDKDLDTLINSFPQMQRVSRGAVIIFHSAKNAPELYRRIPCEDFFAQLVWDKKNMGLGGKFRYQHELISIFGPTEVLDNCSSVLSYFQRDKDHPHQKPVPLMKKLIQVFCEEGHTILDPFMGSGTTGVAAMQTGRSFVGMEIDEQYFSLAEKRIRASRQQPRLI